MASSSPDAVPVITHWLKARLGELPTIGIVCGSGLGHLSSVVEEPKAFRYEDIPLFPQSTVAGHSSELVFGKLGGQNVVLMRGRFHFYEGYSPLQVATPIRVMAALGVRILVVTNAAGGVDLDYRIGDIMVMDDHIFFPGVGGFNPLVGQNDERFGPRFPSMSEPFSKDLQAVAVRAGTRLGLGSKMHENGVYCCVSGPSYETRHEIAMLRSHGGQAVGMSTIQEVVVANHAGMRVLGLSVITNRCKGPGDTFPNPTHEEVLASVKASEPTMKALVIEIVREMRPDSIPAPPAFAHFADPKNALTDAQVARYESSAGGASDSKGADAGGDCGCKSGGACTCAPGACKCGSPSKGSCCGIGKAKGGSCCGPKGGAGGACKTGCACPVCRSPHGSIVVAAAAGAVAAAGVTLLMQYLQRR